MFSLVIKNVRVVDGLGNPWYRADVGVAGDEIAFIGRLEEPEAERVIDGRDRILSPGFIDMHSHGEMVLLNDRQIELMQGRIRQGVTTEIIGNCGISVAPVADELKPALAASVSWMTPEEVEWSWNSMGEFLEVLEQKGVVINVGTLTGHGAIRTSVKGFAAGLCSPAEIEKMKDLLRETFEQGSFGLSNGLIYAPGMFADTEEFIELGRVVAEYDAIFTSHIRGSSETDVEAQQELLTIGERTGCRVHRSHYEAFGRDNWHKIEITLRMDEEARARGVDMAFDMFPYTAANTMMVAIYPPWTLDGGWEKFLAGLRDPEVRRRAEHDIENVEPVWPTWRPGSWPHNLVKATGWENIYIGYIPSEKNKPYEGLSLAELGRARGKSPFDAITDLMIEEEGAISQIIFGVSGDRDNEEPMMAILTHPLGGFATDTWDLGRGKPHPAAFGMYPRILGRYVREQKRLTLEDAVRRMTSFPANRVGLKKRGVVAEGYYADLVVFDPETVIDASSYEEPRRNPVGIDYVIVNGRIVVEEGRLNHIRPGKVLRKTDAWSRGRA